MNLIAELKRRNVIRMAGLYLVGAWLVAQVAETILPAFEVPSWVMRALIIVLALGFVPAMAVAWIFELTPQGLKRDVDVLPEHSIAPQTARRMDRMLLLVSVLALGYFAFDKFVLDSRRDAALVAKTTETIDAEAKAVASKVDPRSIAVLPFVNMSEDKDNEYFSDGISEELLNVLVRVQGFNVASRTSSFAFKGSESSATEIAKALKVKYILEGSVRKQGDQVRITAQLIDSATDRHLMSETYDRQLNDIFAVQDEIANAIVAALRGSLTTAKTAPAVRVRADTENMQAYELYLKARENFIARRDLSVTAGMFQRVVQLDPKFARGWEGLAAVSAVAPGWGLSDRDYGAIAVQAAERALALDPSLSMPWAVRALLGQGQWPTNFSAVFADFDKAIAADPRNATALLWRGITWTNLGFFDRALTDLDRAVSLEPNYLNASRHKALALLLVGREDEAIALFESGVAKGFVNSRSENFVAPMLARGRRTEALLLMGVATLPPELREALVTTLDHPEIPHVNARALVERHAAEPGVDPITVSHLSLWLGDYNAVGASDDRVTQEIVAWDRYPTNFRNSPGMKMKLEKMGVLAYWRANGYPPQCHPVGDKDFNCD